MKEKQGDGMITFLPAGIKKKICRYKDKEQSDFIWNMIGNISFAMMSILLLFAVTNILDGENGGIFSFAFSMSQLLSTIGLYGMRRFQVTDSTCRYSFTNYFLSRVITASVMVAGGFIVIFWNGYAAPKSIMVFLFCLYRIGECLGDAVEGDLQQNDRLYISGKLQTIRVIIPAIVFVAVLFATKDIVWCSFAYMLASLLVFIFFCMDYVKEQFEWNKVSGKEIKGILRECFPLFCALFMATYIVNIPKYILDEVSGSQTQVIYTIISIPIFAVNLLSALLYEPYLVRMSLFWEKCLIRDFLIRAIKILVLIMGITVLIVIAGNAIGLEILNMIYSVPDILQYKREFNLLLIGAGANAGGIFLSNMLVIFRKQKQIFSAYIFIFLCTGIICGYLVRQFAVLGAAWTFFISCLMLFLIFGAMFVSNVLNKMINRGKEE